MITITQRFRPFSHKPGASALIPGSLWSIVAYPAKIILQKEKVIHELNLDAQGPVEGFTFIQNLEKDRIEVFGKAQNIGFFKLFIEHIENNISFTLDRGSCLKCLLDKKSILLNAKESFTIEVLDKALKLNNFPERLFLGVHKKQDWDRVSSRASLLEMLPFVFLLGQKTPSQSIQDIKNIEHVLGSFSGILVPDQQHAQNLGVSFDLANRGCLLASLYKKIRSEIFQERDNALVFSDSFFQKTISGRVTGLITQMISMNLYWVKKKLRMITFKALSDGQLFLDFTNKAESFRMRLNKRDKGVKMTVKTPLQIQQNQIYIIDNIC